MKPNPRAGSPEEERTAGSTHREHHHVHHSGPYMDIEGNVDILYGDGTPGSLVDALAEPPSDHWRPEHSPWDAVRASWESMWQANEAASTAAASGRPSQAADEERT